MKSTADATGEVFSNGSSTKKWPKLVPEPLKLPNYLVNCILFIFKHIQVMNLYVQAELGFLLNILCIRFVLKHTVIHVLEFMLGGGLWGQISFSHTVH